MDKPTQHSTHHRKGIEQRLQQRRQHSADRREEIRFELDKEPRRQGEDRRGDQNIWKTHHRN